MKYLIYFLILSSCSCLFGCENGGGQEQLKTETYLGSPIFEASNVEIKDGVKTFKPANGLVSVIIEPERLLYEFTAEANAEINVGDVLVGAENNGFIRRALTVSRSGNAFEVTTERATLLDALQSADISIRFGPSVLLEDTERATSPNANDESDDDNDANGNANEIEVDLSEDQSSLTVSGQQLTTRRLSLLDERAQFFKQLNRELNYPLLGDVGDGIWLTGLVSTALDLDFTLKIRDGQIVASESELSAEIQGSLTLWAESTFEAGGQRDIPLLSLRPIVLVGAVGFLPFVVTLTPEIGLTFDGRIGTNASLFTARMSASSEASAKIVYQTAEDSWQSKYEVSPPNFNADVDVRGSRITNSITASVALVPQVNIQFYESSGARLKAPLTVEAKVETDTQEPCAHVGLDLTASILLTPESRWDWITDIVTIDEIELVETSLASATFTPCRETTNNDDPTRLDGGMSVIDERDIPIATNAKCPWGSAWRVDNAEGEFTVSINGDERQSLRLDPSLEFGGQFLTSFEDQPALCAEVFWSQADWDRDGVIIPPSTLFNFEAILVDDSGTPRAKLSNIAVGGNFQAPGNVNLNIEAATGRGDEYVSNCSFNDVLGPPSQGSISIEVDQPACGSDYVLVMEDLPLTGGYYFGSENQTGDREDPVVTMSGRLRFQLPEMTELSTSEIQPLSDCDEAKAGAFDMQSSAPDVLPFTGQCMSGRAVTAFNFSEWALLSFRAEPVDAVHRHHLVKSDLWELVAQLPNRVEANQVLRLVTVTEEEEGPKTVEDGVAFMSLGYDGDGMSGLDWRATSGEIIIDSVELGGDRQSPPQQLSARFEATFERVSCPINPNTPSGPVTVTGRIEVDHTDP